jgi:adenine deaminase
MAGYAYMRESARDLPMDIFFSIPSCVPATHLETAGATLDADSVAGALDAYPDAPALSEMMNFPGVLFGVDDVIRKIAAARDRGFPVDGHSPGLAGPDLDAYLNALIMTDHECMTADEARAKLRRGMWVFMREGSAARNLVDLVPVVDQGTLARLCIASDDRHPDDLVAEGHMDNALRVAVGAGVDPLWALRMVTLNPAQVYGFRDRGGIAPGFRADLAILDSLESFNVRAVYHRGRKVAENGRLLDAIERKDADAMLSSVRLPVDLDAKLKAFPSSGQVRVIGVEPSQITTRSETGDASDAGPGKPLQFLAVVERHRGTGNVGLGFARGFDLEGGAFASTVSHDSHNLVLVGASPLEMSHAARTVEDMGGGFAVVRKGEVLARLPLPVGGLMSRGDARETASALAAVHDAAKACGCNLPAPFMTLAFLALPVIPALKLTDKGLVDVGKFDLVSLTL